MTQSKLTESQVRHLIAKAERKLERQQQNLELTKAELADLEQRKLELTGQKKDTSK